MAGCSQPGTSTQCVDLLLQLFRGAAGVDLGRHEVGGVGLQAGEAAAQGR